MASSRRVVAMSRLFALTAVGLCIIATRADSTDIGTSFRRGIGISHAMAWARIDSVTRDFAFPPFSEPANALTGNELQSLRRTGFDFVRLAVDPGPFLQFQGRRRDALDDILIDCVSRILTARLSVVVDFHPSDLHPDYTARALTAGLDTPLYQSYLRMLERTARLLDRLHSRKVAIEPMNEPPRPPDVWQPMLEAAYAAVRRGSTNLLSSLTAAKKRRRQHCWRCERLHLPRIRRSYSAFTITIRTSSLIRAHRGMMRGIWRTCLIQHSRVQRRTVWKQQLPRSVKRTSMRIRNPWRTAMRGTGCRAIVAPNSMATRSPRASSKSPIGRDRKAWRRIGSCSVNSAPGKPICSFPVPALPSVRNGSTTCANRQKCTASAGPFGPIGAAAASPSCAVKRATTSNPVSRKHSG